MNENIIDEICTLYNDGSSIKSICKKYKSQHPIIKKILLDNFIKIRSKSESHRKYEINQDFFDDIDNEEKAYFLGFLYADGSNSPKNSIIRIGLKENDSEIKLLTRFANLIYKKDGKDRIKFYQSDRNLKNGKGGFYGIKTYKTVDLAICCKYMCEQLGKLGCTPNKSLTLTFPDVLDSKLYNHFIRGYFDGDGNLDVAEKRSANVHIAGTENFLNKIKEIIELECKSYVNVYKRKTIHIAAFSGNRQTEKILNWLYKDATIYLERKYNTYIKLIDKNKSTDNKISERNQNDESA